MWKINKAHPKNVFKKCEKNHVKMNSEKNTTNELQKISHVKRNESWKIPSGKTNELWKICESKWIILKTVTCGSKSVMMVWSAFLLLSHLSVVSTQFPFSTAIAVKVIIVTLIKPGEGEQRHSQKIHNTLEQRSFVFSLAVSSHD